MKNFVRVGDTVELSGPLSSGDPAVVGQIAAVAAVDIASGETGVGNRKGVYALSVKGTDGTSDAAIAKGDKLYFTDGDTPKINVRVAGVFFGYADEVVTSGATTTIDVILAG